MRVDLGPAAADVLFVLAGLGVVNAVGFTCPAMVEAALVMEPALYTYRP